MADEIQVNVKYHTLIAAGFPIKQFEEWKKQCQIQFNDRYWEKVWTDHLKARAYDAMVNK